MHAQPLYQIHRYPADLIDVVRMGGGQRVLIRPILPQDEELTAAFFSGLPARARHDRFLAPMRELPPALARRFTHVDYASHLALVAETFAGGRETVIAEARYACGPDPSVAEFAVTVADAWQGRGLASLLLCKLLNRAARAGIERIVGETLAGNDRMLHLARKAGFTATPSTDVRGVVRLEKVLGCRGGPTAPISTLPAHAARAPHDAQPLGQADHAGGEGAEPGQHQRHEDEHGRERPQREDDQGRGRADQQQAQEPHGARRASR